MQCIIVIVIIARDISSLTQWAKFLSRRVFVLLLANATCAMNRLSQCGIEAEGCRHLASALEKNPERLKVLDLSINIIRDKGAKELFEKFNISKLKMLE